MISVTGDTDTGKHIARTAADRVKRLHLELGGKAPVVVFDDADLDAVIENLKVFALLEQRPGLHGAVSGDHRAEGLRPLRGRPGRPGQDDQVGRPGRGRRHRDGLAHRQGPGRQGRGHGRAGRSRSGGAEIVAGGHRPDRPGAYFEPTVIAGPDQDSEIVQDEVFGPVVTVQRFSDEDQAIAWANDVRFGLAASVWSGDVGKAMRVAKAIQFGTVWINDHFTLVSEMPHGGFKESGYGKDQSMYAVEDYTVVKHVMIKL